MHKYKKGFYYLIQIFNINNTPWKITKDLIPFIFSFYRFDSEQGLID